MQKQEQYSTSIPRSYGPKHDHLVAEREAWNDQVRSIVNNLPSSRQGLSLKPRIRTIRHPVSGEWVELR